MTRFAKDRFMAIVIAAVVLVVLLAAAKAFTNRAETRVEEPMYAGKYHTICLDGVLYWNQYRKLAPYIDKETLTYKRCEVAK